MNDRPILGNEGMVGFASNTELSRGVSFRKMKRYSDDASATHSNSPHLDYADLTQRYVECQDAGEKNRWLVIRLLSHPKTAMSIEQTAEICGLSCSGVQKIARRYNAEGAVGLINRQSLNPGGNRLALRDEQQQQLRQRLQSPPDDGGLWSGPKVGEYIENTLAFAYTPQRHGSIYDGWD